MVRDSTSGYEATRPTHTATLESRASSSAAAPVTAAPLVSFSISNPPSYRPISIVGFAGGAPAAREGEGGRAVAGCCLWANEDAEPAFCRVEVGWKGLGAAYLDKSLDTFVWLGFFWCCAAGGRVPAVLGLEDISRAEIWRVSWLTDVMMGFADAEAEKSVGGRRKTGRAGLPTRTSRTRNVVRTRFGFEPRATRDTYSRLVM